MNLNTKAIFTTDEFIKSKLVEKLGFKREVSTNFELFIGKREIEEVIENIILIFSSNPNMQESVNYVKENYLIEKFLLVGNSFIVRNQDLEVGDIMIPNSFLDSTGEKALFIDYAVGENYDLNKFGLILNGVSMESNIDLNIENIQEIRENYVCDIIDNDSYKFLSFLNVEEMEKSVVIRVCIEIGTERNNNMFIDNLSNIIEIMI
nr:hypothetical protein [Candidatus Gracilibacteria bacterium]